MGNVSSLARASSALDSYVAELGSDISYEKSLSSSRFLKTILIRHSYGLLVLKLFIKPDPSISLRPIQRRLKTQRDALNGIQNVWAYQTFIETDKAGYLIRQWAGSSLYDRISTRPYLAPIEKKWIAFQLLSALRDARARDVSHGDLKSENILITPSLSVLVTDFASSFKPTYLPLNDPSDFSYFYDSSGRRTCYVAPERFYTEDSDIAVEKRAAASQPMNELASMGLSNVGIGKRESKVTEAMDVFSAGCVLLEMWTDGSGVFTLSELYTYREGNTGGLAMVLETLQDPLVKAMLTGMVALDPLERPSFEQVLEDYRMKVFPEHFYSFMMDYTALPLIKLGATLSKGEQPNIAEQAVGRADAVINNIRDDWEGRIKATLEDDHGVMMGEKVGLQTESSKKLDADGPALLLLDIITSEVRNCARASSRIGALQPLLDLCRYITDEEVLDRMVPYIVYLTKDDTPQVRAESCRVLVAMLATVSSVSAANKDIVTEYILQNIKHLCQDEDVFVRCTYAQNLPVLAEIGMNLLEMSQAASGLDETTAFEVDTANMPEPDYDALISDLHAAIEEQAGSLLLDPSGDVKRAALSNITSLCLFFGRSKTNDVLLSRMITYLNGKEWRLRFAFLESIVSVAALVGSTSLEEFVLPLMEQALADTEDLVVARVLASLCSLTELGLFTKSRLWDFVSTTYGFLCHPSPWIRQASAAFLSVAAKHLPASDVWCIIYPYIRPLLQTDVKEMTDLALLDVVKDPLKRSVLDAARTWASQSLHGPYWSTSRNPRTLARGRGVFKMNPSPLTKLPPMSSKVDAEALALLRQRGLDEEDEIKLEALKDHIATQAAISVERGDGIRPVVPINTSFTGKMVSLTDLHVTPLTVFIPQNRPGNEKIARQSISSPLSADSRRGSTVGKANRMMSEDSSASDNNPLSEMRKQRLGGGWSGDTSTEGITQALTAMSSPSRPDREVEPASSSQAGSVVASLTEHAHRAPYARSSKSRVSLGKTDHNKAVPEVSAVRALAIGHMESTLDMHTLEDTAAPRSGSETPVSGSVANLPRPPPPSATVPFISSYEGRDPGILNFLQEVHAATIRSNAPLAELGPHVTPSGPRKRSRKPSALRNAHSGHEPTLLGSYNAHAKAIIGIVVSPDNLFYATASMDGVVNVWDINRLERNVSSKPRLSYTSLGKRLYAICGIENTHCVAISTEDGFEIIRVFSSVSNGHRRYGRVERMKRYQAEAEEGSIVSLQHLKMPDGVSSMIYATSTGKVVVLDLRTMAPTSTMLLQPGIGIPTTICSNNKRTWAAVTTSLGRVCILDLRFGLLLRTIRAEGCITTTTIHPSEGHDRWLMLSVDQSAAAPDGPFERVPERLLIQTFDIATGELVQVFGSGDLGLHRVDHATNPSSSVIMTPAAAIAKIVREDSPSASTEPTTPFGEDPAERHQAITAAILTSLHPTSSSDSIEHSAGRQQNVEGAPTQAEWLITGGEDRLVRAWNLKDVKESFVLTGASRGSEVAYRCMQDGLPYAFVQEYSRSSTKGSSSKSRVFQSTGEDLMAGNHTRQILRPHFDAITALASLETPHSPATVIVSGDRSGCLKVWRME